MTEEISGQAGAGYDIRTRRQITTPTPAAPKSQKDILEFQRKRKLLRELVAHPGWAIFRAQSYALVKPTMPTSLDTLVLFMSSAISRTCADMIFNFAEGEAAQALSAEEAPIVDKMRPSFFAENTKLSKEED